MKLRSAIAALCAASSMSLVSGLSAVAAAPLAVPHNGCYFYTLHNLPCLPTVGLQAALTGTSSVSLPLIKPNLNWGSTVELAIGNFPIIQASNFENNPAINTMLSNMSNAVMAEWSLQMKTLDLYGYYTGVSLEYAAAHGASAANLHRLESAVGPTDINTALHYASTAVYAEYNATPMLPVLDGSAYWKELGYKVPVSGSDDHLLDLFLDQVTSQTTESSQASAHKAMQYAEIRLGDKGIGEILAGIGAAGVVFEMYSKFDPNAVNEIKAWFAEGNSWNWGFSSYQKVTVTIPDLTDPPFPPTDPDMPTFPALDFTDTNFDVCEDGVPC